MDATPDDSSPPFYFIIAGLIDQLCVVQCTNTLAALTSKGCEDVHILIHSIGGHVNDGMALYNFFLGSPMRITTYNIGHVASAAMLPFLAGHKRVVADGATFMAHQPSNQTNATDDTVGLVADSLRIDKDRYAKAIHARCTIPPDKWAVTTHNDLIFDAKTALEWGVAHELGLFKAVGQNISWVQH